MGKRVRRESTYLLAAVWLSLVVVQAAAADRASLDKSVFAASDTMETRLHVAERGYFSLRVKSPTGTRIALTDRMAGLLSADGTAGKEDGRLDLLLETGEYKVSLVPEENAQGNIELELAGFKESNPGATIADLPFFPDGEQLSTTLGDLETRSWWIYLPERGELRLEVLGRALKACALWQNGQWLSPANPTTQTYEPESGRPMLSAEFHHTLEAGHYLLVCVGGTPRPWAAENGQTPLYLRRGVRFLGPNGMRSITLSPFGRDAFQVGGKCDFFECIRDDLEETRLRVGLVREGQSRFASLASASITKDSKEPRAILSNRSSADKKWLIVEAKPGARVDIGFFRKNNDYTFPYTKEATSYWVSSISSNAGKNLLDVTPILYRRDGNRIIFLSDMAVHVGPAAPFVRKFNLFGLSTIYLSIDEPGTYRFTENAAAGGKANYRLSLLEERWLRGKYPEYKAPGQDFQLVRGYYLLEIQPVSYGILHTALHSGGVTNPDKLLDSPPPGLTYSFVWPRIDVKPQSYTYLTTNAREGLEMGLDIRELPLSLNVPLSFSARPGESTEVSITVEKESVVRVEGPRYSLTLSGKRIEDGAVLAPGAYNLVLKNDHTATALFTLSTSTRQRVALPKPVLKSFAETYPVFEEGKPWYADFERGQTINLLLIVTEPSLYKIETSGRLALSLSVRTPIVTSLLAARENGVGRNALIESYLRPGDYLVSVTADGKSRGRAGISLTRTPLEEAGLLSPGLLSRKTVEGDLGLRYRFTVGERAEYSVQTYGLGIRIPFRLEDADGYPVTAKGAGGTTAWLTPGDYYYYSLPVSFTTRRLTRFERKEQPAASRTAGKKSYALSLNREESAVWEETPDRTPDTFTLTIPARLSATVTLSAGMDAIVTAAEGKETARVFGGQEASLEFKPGTYEIRISAREVRNLFRYTIAVTTGMLAPGLRYSVDSFPVEFTVSAAGNRIVDMWSFGTSDVKASLWDEAGTVLLAENDDMQDDWNFRITQRLPDGYYRLRIERVGSVSGTVEVNMDESREETVEQQKLPITIERELGREILQVPLTLDADGIVSAAASRGDGVRFAVYRGPALLAESDQSLALPLAANVRYTLHIWQRQDSPQQVKVGIVFVSPPEITLPAKPAVIDCPPFVAIRNPERASYTFSTTNGRLLFSAGREAPFQPVSGTAYNTRGERGYLAVTDGRTLSGVQVAPLTLVPDRRETFFLGEIPQVFQAELADDRVYAAIVESPNTKIGALILSRTAWQGDSFNWRGMDASLSRTWCLLPGKGVYRGRLWTTAPMLTPERIILSLRAFPIAMTGSMKTGERAAYRIEPGKALRLSLPAGSGEIRLLLAEGCVASSWNNGLPENTAVADTANREVRFTVSGGVLAVANTGAGTAPVALELLAGGGSPFFSLNHAGLETALQNDGSVTYQVLAGKENELLCLAGDDVDGTLRGANGTIIRGAAADGFPNLLTFPAVGGELDITYKKGFLKVFYALKNELGAGFAGKPGSLSSVPFPGAAGLSGKEALWSFSMTAPGFVEITSGGAGLVALFSGDRVLRLTAGSSSGEKRILHYLSKGEFQIYARPLEGIPRAGTIRLNQIRVVTLTAKNAETTYFIGRDDVQIFQFTVSEESLVGAGLVTETDSLSASLYSADFTLIKQGALIFNRLPAGTYFLVVRGDARPVAYRPIVFGNEGSVTGIPKEVIDRYRDGGQSINPDNEDDQEIYSEGEE